MIPPRWIPALLWILPLQAATVPLEPFAATNFTISIPKAWVAVEDAKNGLVVARQDRTRDDSALVLFMVTAAQANVSEVQLMDNVAGQFAKNISIRKRDALPGGGHQMIGDGTMGTNPVRVGVIALITNGAAMLSLLVSKQGDFDALGGLELPTKILTSIKARDTPAAPTSQQQQPPATTGGKLDVPPLSRSLSFADLAGEWGNDDSVITRYATYRGDYAGFESIAIREKWMLDAKGGISGAFSATTAGRGGARQINEKRTGTLAFSPGPVMTLRWTTGSQPSYVIRGWRELDGGLTILLLNGPWYGDVPADVLADRGKGVNLNSYWVRKTKPQ